MLTVCSICGVECVGQPQARLMRISKGFLSISPCDMTTSRAQFDERANSCGQHHALILVERYLDRGTFAPADHTQIPEAAATSEPAPHDELADANSIH